MFVLAGPDGGVPALRTPGACSTTNAFRSRILFLNRPQNLETKSRNEKLKTEKNNYIFAFMTICVFCSCLSVEKSFFP
jgi:hypothetical protein